MTRWQTTKNRVEDSIPGLRCPTCGRSSCEEGLTRLIVLGSGQDGAPLWRVGWAMGKGGVSAQALDRNPWWDEAVCNERLARAQKILPQNLTPQLAYIRLLLSYVIPPSEENPSVREIRYNFINTLNPFKNHSIIGLACWMKNPPPHA